MARKYTAAQFIKAIPGTGGVISQLADKVGCDWHTAKRYIEEYVTVRQAWEAERHKITDMARHNIVQAIDGGDLALSKWWLQVMDPDFVPTERFEHSGRVEFDLEEWRRRREKRRQKADELRQRES